MHIITSTTSRINIVFNISCFESLGEPIGEVAWTSSGRWELLSERTKRKRGRFSFGGVRGGRWRCEEQKENEGNFFWGVWSRWDLAQDVTTIATNPL